MLFSVISMFTTTLTKNMRTHVAKTHGLLDIPKTTIPVSVFWLIEFVWMEIAEMFYIVVVHKYFYDQVIDSMRRLGIAFYLSVLGVAIFLGSFLVTIVEGVSK